jgi:arylsulfatase
MITFMDKQIGRLFALLKELDLDGNTVVFFTSDNGTTFLKAQVDFEFFDSVGGLNGLKGSVLEGGIRVPLLVRWPGKIKRGAVVDHISAHYDAMATIAEIGGANTPDDTDGISYLSTLMGRKQKPHDYLFWDYAGYGAQLAVRQGDWKAVRRGLKKNPDAPLQLFNLKDDPAESRDLAGERPQIAKRLGRIMLDAREKPEIERFRFGQYR